MISKEDLEKITGEAYSSYEDMVTKNFNDSVVLIDDILDTLFIEIYKEKYEKSIEEFILSSAKNRKRFVELILVKDKIYQNIYEYGEQSEECYGSIDRIKVLKPFLKPFQNIKSNVLNYYKFKSCSCYYGQNSLEITKSSFMKKFKFYDYEVHIRIKFDDEDFQECTFTVHW